MNNYFEHTKICTVVNPHIFISSAWNPIEKLWETIVLKDKKPYHKYVDSCEIEVLLKIHKKLYEKFLKECNNE